jgi:eukaryotic-like serine/threonine-protein kinase
MSHEPSGDTILMSLVESALGRSGHERKEFIETVRVTNPELYSEVRSRVEWEERMKSFLCDPILPNAAGAIFQPGELVGERFLIVREAGHGGMGVVYEAEDRKLNRTVAIKCGMRNFASRLTPEARAALEVSHPNVCKLHELHTAQTASGPVDFLTMEFVRGETLKTRLDRDGPFSPKTARTIALQICQGLSQAHARGIIHGDIKAGNIILEETAEGALRAVLMDFGLARLTEPSGSVRGAEVPGGTLHYMAPELLEGGSLSVASDVFALGVLLHYMLTGVAPVANIRVDLPAPWKRIIVRCIEVDAKRRFESVDQIAAALNRRRSVTRSLLAAAMAVIAVLGYLIWRAPDNAGAPVRLAVLPVRVQGSPVPWAAALGADIAGRLSGVRKRFTVIRPEEAQRARVDTPEQARAALRATHVIRIALKNNGAQIDTTATVIDAASGQTLRELHGDYVSGDQAVLARALLATVTGAFRLRSGVPRESVAAPAYGNYVQGVALMRLERPAADAAMPLFRKAMEADPQSALPWAGLAEAELQKFLSGAGRHWLDDADAHAAKARSINSDALAVVLVTGEIDQEHGRYESAIANFGRATELDPGDARAWGLLARVFERTDRAAEAAATYQKAIAAQPDSYWPWRDLGRFYFFRNQFHEAEKMYRRASELAPTLSDTHMDLGLALMEQGKFPEAERSMLKALSLSRTSQTLLNTGALYYEEGRYDEAARLFAESLKGGPATIVRYRDLGDALRHLGRRMEARTAYNRGVALAEEELSRDPRRAYSRAQLALLLAQMGERRRAEFEFAEALVLEPENALVMREAIIGYEALGERDRSLALLRRAPSGTIAELNRNPDVPKLREDPAFQDMIGKLKF